MALGVQSFCGDIIVLLRGSDGMLDAANRYCDEHSLFDLSEYTDWLIQHKLTADFFLNPEAKGLIHKLLLSFAIKAANQQLKTVGALLHLTESEKHGI